MTHIFEKQGYTLVKTQEYNNFEIENPDKKKYQEVLKMLNDIYNPEPKFII